jgi:hypothetical protein
MTINGKKSSFTLAPDEIRTVRSQTKITLNINDGGAINVTKNGRDLGIPGNLNEPIQLEY